MYNKTDKTIICKHCGKEFTFTAKDQVFYEEKGFSAPVRCKQCREDKKAYTERKQAKSE
jgi:predicted RNA-binding Zn-ribbon protein involved in translation (DUF1610 family)